MLHRAVRLSSLTASGRPFRAVLEISGPTPAYTGTVELAWLAPQHFRLTLASPGFQQLRIVDGDRVFEKNDGDYYPGWLKNFEQALLDPVPISLFAAATGAQPQGQLNPTPGVHVEACIRRDDRPGGITDQLTWGIVCFWDGPEPHLRSVLTFNRNLEFTNFHDFRGRDIAYTISTSVLDYKPVTGHLTTLEDLSPADPKRFTVDTATAPAELIETSFISTQKAQSLYESSPPITWPTTREGRTVGYMIVYARTDRTGQVRESAKHNSDNPGLEQFGMEQALLFKFKPFVIDGVPQQMEIPIVLHFSSAVADPLPILNDDQTRAQISGCSLPRAKPGQTPFRIRVSVNEQGMLTGESYLDANNPAAPHQSSVPGLSLRTCNFAPYLVNGVPTYYHGDLLLP